MSLNARLQGQDTDKGIPPETMLQRLRQGALRRQTILRQVMEANSYGNALALAASLPSLDSFYITLAGTGPYEGAVVTRYGGRSGSDVWPLSTVKDLPGDGACEHWFRVQANVDHWVPTGPYSTHRRDHAIQLVAALGQDRGSSQDGLLSVLTNRTATFDWKPGHGGEDTGAILRPDTVLTMVMHPAEGRVFRAVWASDATIEGWQPSLTLMQI